MALKSPQATPIEWSIQDLVVGGRSIPIARLLVSVYFRTILGHRAGLQQAWLDTAAPLSVIPFRLHRMIMWQPLGLEAIWAGQPFDLGTLDIWLPTRQPSTVLGPFSIVAKFPHRDSLAAPVPSLLGLEFLLTHQAHLGLAPPPTGGLIRLP